MSLNLQVGEEIPSEVGLPIKLQRRWDQLAVM